MDEMSKISDKIRWVITVNMDTPEILDNLMPLEDESS